MTSRDPDASSEVLRRLENIEHQVTSIDETSAFAMRASKDAHLDEIDKIFGKGKRRAQVYLAANGRRTVQEIADHLGLKRQNVGSDLRHLGEEGLLVPRREGASEYWSKKAIDRTLGISKHLMKQHSLDKNGLPLA